MEEADLARNVAASYHSAGPRAVAEGEDWYPAAQALAKHLFDDLTVGAGILAALSPLTPWQRNVELAVMVSKGHPPLDLPTLGIACRAVDRMVRGEPWTTVLGGRKTRAFASGIETGGNTHLVCVDRHARDLAWGVAFTGMGGVREVPPDVAPAEYRAVAAAYTAVAAAVNKPAPIVQAVTWVVQRGPIQYTIPVTETEMFLHDRAVTAHQPEEG